MNLACWKVVVVYILTATLFRTSQSKGVILPGQAGMVKLLVMILILTPRSWTALRRAGKMGKDSFFCCSMEHPVQPWHSLV